MKFRNISFFLRQTVAAPARSVPVPQLTSMRLFRCPLTIPITTSLPVLSFTGVVYP